MRGDDSHKEYKLRGFQRALARRFANIKVNRLTLLVVRDASRHKPNDSKKDIKVW